MAMTGVKSHVDAKQTETGIKDAIAQYWIEQLVDEARKLRRGSDGQRLTEAETVARLQIWLQEQTKQPFNPLFAMPGEHYLLQMLLIHQTILGFDPHRDTPVEILHTVLLGIVKYAWHSFNSSWPSKGAEEFVPLQDSIDNGGLSTDPLRAAYIVQYKNNLIGKHFKALMQTIAFHAHRLGSGELHNLTCSIGELGALLWYTEIHDLEVYLVCGLCSFDVSVTHYPSGRSGYSYRQCARCFCGY